MKSTKLFSYISNLQTPIDRKIKPFTKETSINYEINPYNLNPSVGDGGDELASLLWCDKQGNKKEVNYQHIDNLLLLESFKNIVNYTLYVIDFDSFMTYVESC